MKLKPCPFCGSPARLWKWDGGTRIDCSNWRAGDVDVHYVAIGARTKEEAVNLWNRRTEKNVKS